MTDPKIILPGDMAYKRFIKKFPELSDQAKKVAREAIDRQADASNAAFMSTGNAEWTTKTAGEILDDINDIREKINTHAHAENPWFNVQVRTSVHALRPTEEPKVVYKKRWFIPQWYVDRRQRQLNEEHGFKSVPCIYFVNPKALHQGRYTTFDYDYPYLIVHPSLYKIVTESIHIKDKDTFDSLVNKYDSSKRNEK